MKICALLCATALAFAAPAGAVVIDFESAAAGAFSSLTIGDYVFTANVPGRIITTSGSNALFAPIPFIPPFNNSVTLTRTDGAAFNLLSLEVFAADGNGLGVPLTFRGLTSTGVAKTYSTQLPEFGNQAPIPSTRVSLSFGSALSDVVSVRWSNGAEFHQVDNLSVTASSAVPEPASWLLLIGGFGLIGAMARRRTITSLAD